MVFEDQNMLNRLDGINKSKTGNKSWKLFLKFGPTPD